MKFVFLVYFAVPTAAEHDQNCSNVMLWKKKEEMD